MKKHWLKKLGAVILSSAVALSFAVPIFATDAASSVAESLPDETSARTLTIIKYDTATEDADKTGDGTYKDTNTSEHHPMENVIFDVYKYAELDSDVSKSISVDDANAWINEHPDALAKSLVTDADGKAVWKAAESGKDADAVYLVVERSKRAAQITGKADPFFISLPYTDPDSGSWVYDVTVQPKNVLVPGPTVEKDVQEVGKDHAGVSASDTVTWIIQGTVPADLYYTDTVNEQTVEFYAKNYTFTDVLDKRLNYKGNLKVVLIEDKKEIQTLAAADYTVGGDAKEGSAGGTLTVSLTEAGMKDVVTHITDVTKAAIYVYFDTNVNSNAVPGEKIPNDVTLDYTNSTGIVYDPVTVIEENIPEVHTGGFKLLKVDSADSKKLLSGAEFKIAATEEDAKKGNYLKDVDGKEITLTTDKNGAASYKGLAYDTESKDPQGGTYYWIVETKAPTGYKANTTPARITVNADTYKDTATPYTITNEVEPIKKPVPLPLTGNVAGVVQKVGLALLVIAALACGVGLIIGKKKK